ncbi:ComEC/Rec2 family competence protein [Dactylosporangium sp. NPDC005555]|uniref:ComEC/Rec2 family competence protein n=1 Tax=Dactylosporangium sp. NPDC005555 TaxID=3154889 RepID=UPI0033AAB573
MPANLLAAPAVAPATILGILAAVISPVLPGLAEFIAWVAAWPARWLVTIAHHGAAVPDGVLPWPGGVWGGVALGVLLAALIIAFRRRKIRRAVIAVMIGSTLGAVPVRAFTGGWPPPGWIVVACDVGQGDAVVVSGGGGDAIVIDAGPQADPVDRCLRDLGVERVSLLIISHFHVDHIGGLDGVLRRRRVDRLLLPPFAEPAAGRRAVLDRGVATLDAPAGTTFTVGEAGLTVLGPDRQVTGTRSDVNNNSLVVAVTVAGIRMLFTGDAETEEQLSLHNAPLRADVLKVAHHGSAYQDPAFLDAVAPRIALVSVGTGNDYGHPSPVVLARLARGGTYVARTDEQGDVAVIRDADGDLAVVEHGPSTPAR